MLFGSDRPDNHQLLDLVEAEMRARIPGSITFYETYLIINLPDEKYKFYEESQAETLRRNFEEVKLDLVIVVYPQAVEFATRYRDRMFPGVPIVFTGVGIKGSEWPTWSAMTGVTFAVGVRETIDLALRLHPDTQRVAIVAGQDWFWLSVMHSELLRRNVQAVDIIFQGPSREVVEKVAALPPHTVALLHMSIVPIRSEFGSRELIRGVSQILPTYSAWEYTCLDFGCIGGAYPDKQKNAASTADLAARILSGERPADIPVVHDTDLRTTVDWRALQRWHIPESALPPGTLVLYREPTPWKRGRKYFLAGIAIIVVQTLLIFGLFWQRARKIRADAAAKRSEERFSKSFRESPLAIAIVRMRDSHYIDVNETFEQQTGWSRNEVIGRTPLDFGIWEDADQRTMFTKQLLAEGRVRDLEVRIRRKDGLARTTLASAELIEVEGEPCALSVIADISDRRQAEEVLSSVSRRLIEAHEEERVWIARELHDDVNQRLAFVAVKLSSLTKDVSGSDASTKQSIEAVRREISDLGRDVQALSHRLHSSKLEYLGLVAAAGGFCKEFSQQHNVAVEYHHDNIPRNLSPEISLCLFRVLQEALQNALKYSGTRLFEVKLEWTSNEIHLSVRDSGVGFNPESAMNRHGLGLISMTERLKLVDGQLSIDSKPRWGTTIHARVPLNRTVKSAAAAG